MESVYEGDKLKPLPKWVKQYHAPSSNMQIYRDEILDALIKEINEIKDAKEKARKVLESYERSDRRE